MFMITSRKIFVYGAKKLIDNDIFLVMVKYCSVVIITIIANNVSVFWCLSVTFALRNNNSNDI